MDNIKLFAKKDWRQIKTIEIYSLDIGMEFNIGKCVMLIMEGRKREITERIELLNQERMRMLGKKENYKYLVILEANTIKQMKMKEKITKEYLRQMRKLPETSSVAEISLKW